MQFVEGYDTNVPSCLISNTLYSVYSITTITTTNFTVYAE